LKGKTHQIIPY